MSYPFPTTADSPDFCVVMPDWSYGVEHTISFQTSVAESRAGIEDRKRHRIRPMLSMGYEAAMTLYQSRLRLDTMVRQTSGPLLVPWYPDGVRLASTMASATEAILIADPVEDNWPATYVLIFNDSIGHAIRAVESRDGKTVTLEADDTTIFPAGSWLFPFRRAIRQGEDSGIRQPSMRSVTERFQFQTID